MIDGLWDRVAKELYVSREFVKKTAYTIGYGGSVDPWVDHLVRQATIELGADYWRSRSSAG